MTQQDLKTEDKLKTQENLKTQEYHKFLNTLKWPSSEPGPQVTQPPPGQKPMRGRTDQMLEVGYDQEHGVPSVLAPERSLPDQSVKGNISPDQQKTA